MLKEIFNGESLAKFIEDNPEWVEIKLGERI